MIKDKYIHHYFISSFTPCNTSSPFQKKQFFDGFKNVILGPIGISTFFLTKEINRCEIRTILRNSRCLFYVLFLLYMF